MSAYLTAFILPILLLPLRRKSRTAYVFVLAGLWALFAGLRGEIGGKDYYVYRDAYLNAPDAVILPAGFEPLFRALMQYCQRLGLPYNSFLLIAALLGILPAVQVIDRRTGGSSAALYIYGIEFMLYGSFVILRQGIAIGFAFLVLDAVMDGKRLKALLFVLMAAGFHASGFILLAFIILSGRISPRLRTLLYAVSAAAGALLIVFVMTDLNRLIWTSYTDRFVHYFAGGGGMRINPLNFLEVTLVFILIWRTQRKVHPSLHNAFDIFLVFILYGTIEAIFVRIASYFRISELFLIAACLDDARGSSVPVREPRLPHRLQPAGQGFLQSGTGRLAALIDTLLSDVRVLQTGIFCYYLAKITRWLLLNVNDIAIFLPYRTFF